MNRLALLAGTSVGGSFNYPVALSAEVPQRRDDLLQAAKVLDLANTRIFELQAEDKEQIA